MARMTIDGFGQVELNNVAFRRDGRVEAQCALSTVDFASVPAENGMILRVKKASHEICFADASAENQLYALNYTTEHIYDERKPGLKNFATYAQVNGKDGFYPRMGYLAAGDLWTTNCVDLGTYADTSALERDFGFKPSTSLREGLRKFAEWYSGYYQPSTKIASWSREDIFARQRR